MITDLTKKGKENFIFEIQAFMLTSNYGFSSIVKKDLKFFSKYNIISITKLKFGQFLGCVYIVKVIDIFVSF